MTRNDYVGTARAGLTGPAQPAATRDPAGAPTLGSMIDATPTTYLWSPDAASSATVSTTSAQEQDGDARTVWYVVPPAA